MITDTEIGGVLLRLRGRIAEVGVMHCEVGDLMGIDPTKFSAILHGRRKMPEGFEARLLRVLDRMEAAERAGRAARAMVLQAPLLHVGGGGNDFAQSHHQLG